MPTVFAVKSPAPLPVISSLNRLNKIKRPIPVFIYLTLTKTKPQYGKVLAVGDDLTT